MQDISVMMSASGSCRTTCARSLYADLLCKISLSGCLQQDPVGPLVPPVQDLSFRIRRLPSRLHKRNFTSVPSPQRVTLGNQKLQLYQHFARWMHTISAEGCTSKSEITTLPAFRALCFRMYCACREIMSRGHTKCCIGHAEASPSSVPKMQPLGIEPFDLKI